MRKPKAYLPPWWESFYDLWTLSRVAILAMFPKIEV
jgi:hypothetical protein